MIAAELLSTTWACEATALESFMRAAAQPRAAVFAPAERIKPPGDVATIPVRGVLVRGRGDPWLRMFGIANTGYDEIREALAEALAGPAKRIVLDIDSPGGDAHGLASMFRELRRARAEKPITAAISGQGTSAAYYLAAAADEIVAEPDAAVGSIGVYAVLRDLSGMAEQAGVKVHVLRSGPHKGVGTPGELITDEQLSQAQELVDDLSAGFVRAIAEGRGMSLEAASAVATGAAWVASRAKGMGLVDRIGTLADAQADDGDDESRAVATTKKKTPKAAARIAGRKTMSITRRSMDDDEHDDEAMDDEDEKAEDENDDEAMDEDEEKSMDDEDEKAAARTGKPANLATLQRRYRKRCGADFVLEQAAVGATLDQAEMAALRFERDTARRETKRRGVDSRALGSLTTGAAVSDGESFLETAKAYQDKHGGTLLAAQSAVARRHPKLYSSYVDKLRVGGGARRVKSWGGHEPA